MADLTVLHCLSQLPARTGSGIYYQKLLAEFHQTLPGRQLAIYGQPSDLEVDWLEADQAFPVVFRKPESSSECSPESTQLPLDPQAGTQAGKPDQASSCRHHGHQEHQGHQRHHGHQGPAGPVDLPFPICGMSDEMPYPSTIFSQMSVDQVDLYQEVFRRKLEEIRDQEKPDLIICHHLWILARLVLEVFPDVPVFGICHGTDLRQARQHPAFKERYVGNLQGLAGVVALSGLQVKEIEESYQVDPAKIRVMGGAYDPQIFYPTDPQVFYPADPQVFYSAPAVQPAFLGPTSPLRHPGLMSPEDDQLEVLESAVQTPCLGPTSPLRHAGLMPPEDDQLVALGADVQSAQEGTINYLYAGKISHAKGVYELAEAFDLVSQEVPKAHLDIVGSPTPEAAHDLKVRSNHNPRIRLCEVEDQQVLAQHMRHSDIFVLPSYYEGLGLIALEALASGLRLVVTDLPALREQMGPDLANHPAISWVPMPPLQNLDEPLPTALPQHVLNLKAALLDQARKHQAEGQPVTISKLLVQYSWPSLARKIFHFISELSHLNFVMM